MPVQISMDRNIINALNKKLLRDKFLPAILQRKIIVHLTDVFLLELLLDKAVTRICRHSHVLHQIFNGGILLSIKKAFEYELGHRKDLFFDQATEVEIKQQIKRWGQGEKIDEVKIRKLLESKKSYDAWLKREQEMNLQRAFRRIKEVAYLFKSEIEKIGEDWNDVSLKLIKNSWAKRISAEEIYLKGSLAQKKECLPEFFGDLLSKILMEKIEKRKKIEECEFETYYKYCPPDQKIEKLKCALKANNIISSGDICLCLENERFPWINLWLRSWYGYHYYTVKRKQPTLRSNDATDLAYIPASCGVDYFITNDKMLIEVGNMCFNSKEKFISWDSFESAGII